MRREIRALDVDLPYLPPDGGVALVDQRQLVRESYGVRCTTSVLRIRLHARSSPALLTRTSKLILRALSVSKRLLTDSSEVTSVSCVITSTVLFALARILARASASSEPERDVMMMVDAPASPKATAIAWNSLHETLNAAAGKAQTYQANPATGPGDENRLAVACVLERCCWIDLRDVCH